MKRNENIILLSKDHHFGLLCSWKIRQGLKKGIEIPRIKKYVRYFWEHHLRAHFREEEQILFPSLEDDYSHRVKTEHTQIGEAVLQTENSENPDFLLNFANLLEQHIRFEEREWFPHLEKNLESGVLEKIGKELDKIHSAENDDYQDEFWK